MSFLNKIRIGNRLYLGFSFIFIIFLSLSFFSINQLRGLSTKTEVMYAHPLAVSTAVLRIHTNIARIHRSMKDVALSGDMEAINNNAYIVDNVVQEVFDDFRIIEKQFLGEKEKYQKALDVFIAWKPIRDEVIALMLKGKKEEAANITRGKGVLHISKIEDALDSLGVFAQNKAKELLFEAKYTKKISLNYLYFIMFISLVACVTFALLITKSITAPLEEFQKATEKIGKGDFDASVEIHSKDEIGVLAKSFNSMLSNLKEITASRDMLNAEIEERKNAENKLHKSEEKYSTVISDSPVGIAVCNADGQCISTNKAMADLIGATQEQILNQNYHNIESWKESGMYAKAISAINNNRTEHIDVELKTSFDNKVYVSCYFTPIGDGELLVMMQDISELLITQNQLNKALDDKDILIKEVHHRTKNNLAVIQSLLSLQVKDISDDKSKGYFADAEGRVKSMTLIHEMLHKSDDIRGLGTLEYIRSFVNTLFHNYKASAQTISLQYDIQDITLDVDTMIPLGLIINELVSNALKYAFTDGSEGTLSIRLKETEENSYELVIRDTGPGLPEDFDLKKTKSLGLLIVNSLINQIHGTLEISNKGGAEFKIVFTEETIR